MNRDPIYGITIPSPAMVTRPLYTAAQQSRLFAPRRIAVVGASTNARAFGSVTLANIAGPDASTGRCTR
jgi:hypothetical protein